MVESQRQEIAKLEALYASNPGGRVFVHLAEALRRAGEHERARSILEEGLARHPASASGYVVLGRVLIDRGESQEAESAFRKVLQLDGGNLVALRCLGDLARSGGRPAEALTHYRELMARNPSSAADGSLQRLLDETQRGAAEAAAVAAAAAEAEAANRRVQQAGAGAAGVPSDRPAAGRAGPAEPAEAEYGMIELDALPGDLASFAGLAAPEQARVADEPEPEPRTLEDDVVVLIESSAAPLELLELETELAASPAEVNLLSALPEPESVGGELDVGAAMLDVGALSSATPFEIVPEATELTLIDDDSVRVSMPASGRPEAGAEAAGAVESPELGDEAVPDEQKWVGVDTSLTSDDARTQDAAELAPAEATDEAAEYEDLPWLVEPAEAAGPSFAGTGAGEEFGDLSQSAASGAAFPPEPGVEGEIEFGAGLEEEPAGYGGFDASLDIDDTSVGAAADAVAEVGEYFALPPDVAGEFEAPADEMVAEAEAPRESSWPAAEEDMYAPLDLASLVEPIEAEPDLGEFGEPADVSVDLTQFGDAIEAGGDYAAPDEPADRLPDLQLLGELIETAPEFVKFGQPVDEELDRAALGEAVEAEPDRAAFAEPADMPPEFGAFLEDLERGSDRVQDAEPDHARFAEDVEAEPDLATFMDEIESARNAAGFVADAEFVAYEERVESEPDLASFGEAVAGEPRLADYIEDVEAEPDLVGFTDEIRPESPVAGYVEPAEPEQRGFAESAEPAGAESDRASGLSWLDEDFAFAPVEAAATGAPAGGGPEVDELEPLVPGAGEPQAVEVSWQEEIAATGGPEPATVPDVFDEPAEPWTGAESDFSTASELPAAEPVGAAEGPASAAEARAAPSGTDLGTETLADLYLAQGFAQRAAEVYRALRQQRPEDEGLAAKLRDAEAALAGRSADEEAGDVWLRGVESAWTGSAGATGQETTPYAWTEREEREQGIGIGAYLRELISWGTGEPVRPAHGAAEEVGATPDAVPATPDPVPAERVEPPAAEAGTWGAPAAQEPELWGDTLDATELPGAVPDETWNAPEPAEPWSPPVEPPLDPWLAPEPEAVRGPPELTSRGTGANEVEAAFNEWFGPPQQPAAPAAAAHGRPQPAREAGAREQPSGAADDEDDEDLEMFRAWLQSLKK